MMYKYDACLTNASEEIYDTVNKLSALLHHLICIKNTRYVWACKKKEVNHDIKAKRIDSGRLLKFAHDEKTRWGRKRNTKKNRIPLFLPLVFLLFCWCYLVVDG